MCASRMSLALMCLWLYAGTTYAQVTIRGEKAVPLYGAADLKAVVGKGGKDTQYRWKVISGTPIYQTKVDDRFIFTGPPGKYRVTVTIVDFDAKLFDEGEVVVVIGDGPSPPDPFPPPDPQPQPTPLSPLAKLIKTAYGSELDPDKKSLCHALAVVYGEGAKQVIKGTPKTLAQLWKQMAAGATVAKLDGKIGMVQGVVGQHMLSKVGSKGSLAIDDNNRKQVSDALSEVAQAIKEAVP